MSGIAGSAKSIEVANQTSAFNEIEISQLIPEISAQFRYNVNPENFIDNSTGSGSVVVSNPFCVISSGAATSSGGKITSRKAVEYRPGTAVTARFTTIFDIGTANNVQLVGIGTDTNGLFVGYNGASFSVLLRSDGVDTFITQSNFNIDRLDGTGPSGINIVLQRGNVYQIQYQGMKFGTATFSILNQFTGKFIAFHRFSFANIGTSVLLNNPTLPFQAESTNNTNDTDVVMQIPSFGVFSDDNESPAMYLIHGAFSEKTSITTEQAIITIRNNTTFSSEDNFVLVRPQIISAATDGAMNAVVTLYKNATLGGTPSFVDYNANSSCVAIDTAGTTVSSGILLGAFAIAKSDNNILYAHDLFLDIFPGETFTVAATSSGNTDVLATITWQERFR